MVRTKFRQAKGYWILSSTQRLSERRDECANAKKSSLLYKLTYVYVLVCMYLCAHIEFGKVEHCLNYMISQQFVNARQDAQAYPLQICYTQWQEQGKKANCVT